MRICENHGNQQAPLIMTYAFNGSEFWCPYCGGNFGMMGAGKRVEDTPELVRKYEAYKALSKDFLRAKSSQVCESLMHEGRRIPPSELPEEIKQKYRETIQNWKYGQLV